MRFAPVQTDPAALARYGELFAACFPDPARFTPAYLAWLYAANPDGQAVGVDAWDAGRLAAHYVCIPARAWVNGEELAVLLSLNTATHPDYQGRGLFTRLAELTYEHAADAGYGGVYGVANANSTPGFVRKLGFQLVRPLEARVGLGPLLHAEPPPPRELSFERSWSEGALAWRCMNPRNRVWQRDGADRRRFYAAAFGGVLPAYAEMRAAPAEFERASGRQAWAHTTPGRVGGEPAHPTPRPGAGPAPAQAAPTRVGAGPAHLSPHAAGQGSRVVCTAPALSPLRLFIGLAPDASSRYWNYASIPRRLRPSPLNLIYRAFAPRSGKLDQALVSFSFLDFDAY